MKTLALLITLVLHAAGLWPRLPDTTHAHLTAAATTDQPLAAIQTTAVAATLRPTSTTALGPLPIRVGTQDLDLNTASALALDTTTNTILYAKNPATRRPIASVTKLVTALVILSRHRPTDPVTIPQLPAYQPADERIGLIPGEHYTIGDLVQAALINSANDAADALALADASAIPKFAAAMNTKMAEWDIPGTRFSNPTGLIDADNYATADALGKIATLALVNPTIRHIVTQADATITSHEGRSITLTTTNKLLATSQFYGIKTGYTPAAGECFVGLTRIDGHEVVTVVLGASDRFGATQTLVNWISHTYQWL